MKLLVALLLLGCFTSAQAGQRWLFKERLLDEQGVQYMRSGTLNDNCGGSGSMGSTTNGYVYVIGEAQYIPTSCYVSWRSPDGWTFADIPANYLSGYNANMTTAYSRQPCTFNLGSQDLSCPASYMIIPRAVPVYAKKMGTYTSGIPLQYIFTNSSGNLATTSTVTTNASGYSEFNTPKVFQNGLYCYEDSFFGFVPELSSSTTKTVVVPDKTRPNAITSASFVNNTTLALQWENTASVAGVNHQGYVVQIVDEDIGQVVDTKSVVSNSAQVYVPLSAYNIGIYIFCYGETNAEAIYGFNAWSLNLGSPSAASATTRSAARSADIDSQRSFSEQPEVKKKAALKKAPGLLKNIKQYDNLVSIESEMKAVVDDCVDCQ